MATGSVWCRKGVNGNSWCYAHPYHKPDGTYARKVRRGFSTKRAAEAAKAKSLTDTAAKVVEPSKQTVEQFFRLWLEHTAKKVSASSLRNYTSLIENHLIPGLGQLRLDQLTTLVIDQYYLASLAAGNSFAQVQRNHMLLKYALRRARKWQLVQMNPCDDAEPPKEPREIEPEDRRVRALTDEEAQRLLGKVSGPYWLATLIALVTGLRRGECLGLRWQDLDFDAGTLWVRQSVSPPKERGELPVFGPPKTETSRRKFIAPAGLMAELQRHLGRQAQQRLTAAGKWQDFDLVVCRDDGRPFNPDSFSSHQHRCCVRAQLPDVRFHDLRHTFATSQLSNGADVTTVSKKLGHASVQMTLDIYSHVLPNMDERSAVIADAALQRLLLTA